MANKLRVYEVARDLGMEARALVSLLQAVGVDGIHNHMSVIGPEVLDRVKRHIEKQKQPKAAEKWVAATVLKRSNANGKTEVREVNPWALGPVIEITGDMAALLSLQPTRRAVAPADRYTVAISPAFGGLVAVEATAAGAMTPRWSGEAPSTDVSQSLRNIALGACDLMSKIAAPKKAANESNPLGKRDAKMREVIKLRIKTEISDAFRNAARDVIQGRRGYSNVLKESVPVRAHLAKFHTGKGRQVPSVLVRAAHRRGGPGTKERRYQLER